MVMVKNEKKKLRCIPQNLSMSEASPVCQPWSYASDHPMEEVLDPKYFMSAYDRLRPGDTLRAVQMSEANIHSRTNQVLEFANLTVVSVSKEAIGIHVDRRVAIDNAGEYGDVKTEVVGDGSERGFTKEHFDSFCEEVEKRLTARPADNNNVSNIEETVKELQESLVELKKFVETAASPAYILEENGDLIENKDDEASGEVPVIKWNPGKKEHEAITGEGEAAKVLFSNKDKREVVKWLESVAGPNK